MSTVSAQPRAVAVRFLLSADAEPGLLPRLLQPFAKRDLIPERIAAHRDGDVLHVDILLMDPEPGYADLIAGNLGQVIGVHGVRQVREQAAHAA
jgi:hypothetical protein